MNMPGDEERLLQREKRKKILLIAVCAVTGVFLIFGALALILPAIENYLKEQRRTDLENRTKRSYIYPEPDYSLDIFEDTVYLSLDRYVWVWDSDKIARTVITEVNRDNYPVEIQFMYDVVNFIINGDWAAYNKIFTDDYIKNAGDNWRENFTMQQLFDIELEYVDAGELDGGALYYDIQLSYQIRNNNGTFRNDLDFNDGGSIPVVYKLAYDGKNMKVRDVLTHLQYASGFY